MFNRFLLFLIGFGFMIIGFTYTIAYLNLMTIGYTFFEYLRFIFFRFECMLSIIGLIIITISIYMNGEDNDDKCV